MFLNNVKRFVSLVFLVLLIVCSKNVSAQQKNWRPVSLSERQSKTLANNFPASGVFEEIENFNLEDLADTSLKFCLRADPLTSRQNCCKTKSQKGSATIDESSKCDVSTSEIDFKVKTNFSVAARTKPNVDLEVCNQASLNKDYAKNQNLIYPTDTSTRKSFQHFRSDVYPKHNQSSFGKAAPALSERVQRETQSNLSRSLVISICQTLIVRPR